MMSAVSPRIAEQEKRVAVRERVMLTGKLFFNQGTISVDCVVSNISATGVRLSVSADVVLAQTMTLSIPQRQIESSVRLVWRRGNMAALTFDRPEIHEDKSPASGLTREKSLEAENRRLRELLAQMEERLKQMQGGA